VRIAECRYERLEQHHCRYVTHHVRQHRRHGRKDAFVLKIEAVSDFVFVFDRQR
jgi:hypothetical protein